MIDGINLSFKGTPAKRISELPIVTDREHTVYSNTGEIKKSKAVIDCGIGSNINLTYYPNSDTLYMNGSLTKFFKGHNYIDLTFTELQQAVDQLLDTFQFGFTDVHTFIFEFGVNVELPYNPNILLENMLFSNGKMLDLKTTDFTACNYTTSQFILKNYNKTIQAKVLDKPDLLRTEIQLLKGQPVHKLGINHLEQLLIKDHLAKLANMHTQKLNDIFIYDPFIDPKVLTDLEKPYYTNANSRHYWQSLLTDKNKFRHHRNMLKDIMNKYSTTLPNAMLSDLVKTQWLKMINS